MGDEDALDILGKVPKGAAMKKLLEMTKVLEADRSGYYEVPPTLEESLRAKHPAVQDAYNQYQILLKFAKADHYAQEENDNNT